MFFTSMGYAVFVCCNLTGILTSSQLSSCTEKACKLIIATF